MNYSQWFGASKREYLINWSCLGTIGNQKKMKIISTLLISNYFFTSNIRLLRCTLISFSLFS